MREKKWLGPKICFLVGGATYFWIKRWNGSKTKVVLKWGGGMVFEIWKIQNAIIICLLWEWKSQI